MKYIIPLSLKCQDLTEDNLNLSTEVDLASLILTRAFLKTSLFYGTSMELKKEEPM